MEFFDPKEEVMDIQITPYGKYLLSHGLFKPIYYSFHDHDIIYDDGYVATERETQNNAQLRITGSTPRMKAFHVYSGLETEIKRINRLVRYGEATDEANSGAGVLAKVDKEKLGSQNIQPTPDKLFAFSSFLGTGGSRNNYSPAWSITFLSGELSSSAPYLSSSLNKHEIKHIPQLTSSLIYETLEISDEDFAHIDDISLEEAAELDIAPSLDSTGYTILEDGTPIYTRENSLVIEILEENVDLSNENFDIEVFRVEIDDKTKQEIITPLSFVNKPSNIVNGILLDDDQIKRLKMSMDESYVEYYFDLNVDCEIDFTKVDKDANARRGIYLNGLPCLPSTVSIPDQGKDVYGDITDDQVEDCD